MKAISYFVLGGLIALGALGILGAGAAAAGESFYGLTIEEVNVRGLKKTDLDTLRKNMPLKANEVLTEVNTSKNLQFLKNLEIFSQIEQSYLLGSSPEKVIVSIDVVERWTLIPIFNFSWGGGARFYEVGLSEGNFVGRLDQLGGSIENLQGVYSGQAWYLTKFLHPDWSLFYVDVGARSQVRQVYGKDLSKPGGFLDQEQRVRLLGNWDLSQDWRLRVGVQVKREWMSERLLSRSQVVQNQSQFGLAMSPSTTYLTPELGVIYGEINSHYYLQEGFETKWLMDPSLPLSGQLPGYIELRGDTRFFTILGETANFAARFRNAWSTSKILHQQYFLGGLDGIRGFYQNQIHGRGTFLLNTELQVPLWHHSLFVLEQSVFIDSAMAADRLERLLLFQNKIYVGTGAGFRLIFPRVQGFLLRVDYGFPVTTQGAPGLVFGVLQFF